MKYLKVSAVIIMIFSVVFLAGCAKRATVQDDPFEEESLDGMVDDFDMLEPPPMDDEPSMAEPPLDEPPMDEPPLDESFEEPVEESWDEPIDEEPLMPPVAEEKQPQGLRYIVVRGDTLWDISSRDRMYGDPFQWPLIFRANRDNIDDPDIIEIGQELFIRKDFTRSEVRDARQKAMDTPAYVPHTRPRKTLPLQY
ncbi:MAG: LysM peptidoglycan-binding domain-containing protein [Candidatus Goldiibacteriota bacterium]